MTDPKAFEFFEHAADIGLTARGASLPELFQNAGLGLMSLAVDLETVQPGGIRERIRAEGTDRETLLVHWLEQVLFLFNVQQMAFCRIQVRSLTDTSIEAEGEGELFDPGRHGVPRTVKGVSPRGVTFEKDGATWTARIFLDAETEAVP